MLFDIEIGGTKIVSAAAADEEFPVRGRLGCPVPEIAGHPHLVCGDAADLANRQYGKGPGELFKSGIIGPNPS